MTGPAAHPGPAAAAERAAVAVVTLLDPAARVSAPMWRRTERLCTRIQDLLTAAARQAPGGPLDAALRPLRHDPLDRRLQQELSAAVADAMRQDATLAAELDAHTRVFHDRNRIVLDRGPRHENRPADGVPTAAQMAAAAAAEPRDMTGRWDVTVVLDFRDTTSGDRLRNAVATAAALRDQSLDPARHRLVVVEQDDHARHRDLIAPLADLYIHAPHDGPYNRSWAHNVGAVATRGHDRRLLFLDADVLPDRTFLERLLDRLETVGARALLPHESLHYLDESSSETALRARLFTAEATVDPAELHGYRLVTNRGGCILLDSDVFHDIHGFDERYEGWGDEDNEFFDHLQRHTPVHMSDEVLLHLHHPRPRMEDDHGRRPNEWLLGATDGRPTAIGDPKRYAGLPL
ncbi:galactosyltransferase-related protein [Streptomyces sp. LN245]|uniref:galactosyltransferase-related protein n=1 Tax=Streptomyces sp. LN245 TaxID=3112975 RepID=UPI0037139745